MKCHYCGISGHIKHNCHRLAANERKAKQEYKVKQKANKATLNQDDNSSCSETDALVISHALSASNTRSWIVDSGATCHMCNDETMFSRFHLLEQPQQVKLGDGHILEATAHGIVSLQMNLSDAKTRRCKLHDVLFVPKLSYNLF